VSTATLITEAGHTADQTAREVLHGAVRWPLQTRRGRTMHMTSTARRTCTQRRAQP